MHERQHFDVIVMGAGLSGIGAACRLAMEFPDRNYTILEARPRIGGTWDLFRYPGVRSDSDMFTLGYRFEPWTDPKGIADGDAILSYIRRTARKHGVDRSIRFNRRVERVEWDGETATWTVTVRHTDDGAVSTLTCSFLWGCTGYYRYDHGYQPDFAGLADFAGTVVHPQAWPDDLDYGGKRVVVVGSGATAVTIVPAMAQRAAHVTMLQRSPTHIMPLPSVNPLDERIRRLLPTKAAYGVLRWKHLLWSQFSFELSRRRPDLVRRAIREEQQKLLPPDFAFEPHLNPTYEPWDQRLCVAADGDLFEALATGDADVVTDTVETFTPTGIRLVGGRELEADIVVLATGLELLTIGGVEIVVDGRPIDIADEVSYKGAMLSGVPNFVFTVGYTNASWTLKADLVADYVCRLLRYMVKNGYQVVLPVAPPDGGAAPIIDLKSGYVLRALERLPKQGARAPWRLHQSYPRDLVMLRYGQLADQGVQFRRAPVSGRSRVPAGR